MPGKVKVKVVAGRSLPVMDRSNDTTDAYVEVKLGAVTHKTDVCRKSLNPQWNSEWFRFEMDDLELQDEPLQIRLMDYDTYSANDAIGKVYLDLNPLLITTSKGKDNSGKMISGWIPVYDTMHGIRGEVNLIVKVELFSDLNKYRQSSCGVRFFFTQTVPEGYIAHTIQGFVEELVVNDDPEYQWIDKIRTPRASNEARQTLFSKLSGEVQRKVGLKALELGGNAVIGYKQCLDLEGESGIVVRGIGTAIFLTKLYENQLSPTFFDPNGHNRESMESHPLCKSHLNRSLRKERERGGSPGRTPRLKRSFRAPSSTLVSMAPCEKSLRHQLQHVLSTTTDADEEFLTISSSASAVCAAITSTAEIASTNDIGGSSVPGHEKQKHSKREQISSSSRLFGSGGSPLKVMRSVGSASSSMPSVPAIIAAAAPSQRIFRRSSAKLKAQVHVPSSSSAVMQIDKELIIQETSLSAPEDALALSIDSFPEYLISVPSSENPNPPLLPSCPALLLHSTSNSISISKNPITHHPVSGGKSTENIAESIIANTNRARNSNSMSSDEFALNKGGSSSGGNLSYNSINDIFKKIVSTEEPPRGNIVSSKMMELGDSTLDHSHLSITTEENPSQENISTCKVQVQVDLKTNAQTEAQSLVYRENLSLVNLDMRKKREPSEESENNVISPTSTAASRFALLRKRRGSRKKDKFSTNCLIKRASEVFVNKEAGPSGKERLKEEFNKLLKRMSIGDNNNENSSSSNSKYNHKAKSSPYREPKKRFLFRRRRRTASGEARSMGSPNQLEMGKLIRSTSESRSLGQTSLESLPSMGSEPAFNCDEDDDFSDPNSNSFIEMPALEMAVHHSEMEISSKIEREELVIGGIGISAPTNTKTNTNKGCSNSPSLSASVDQSELKNLIKGLGYDTRKPLKLYVSSLDALLVYDPLDNVSSLKSNIKSEEPVNVLASSCGGDNDNVPVVNLDSDSDFENLIHLSRTSTGSSVDAQPFHLRKRQETLRESEDKISLKGTESSLSTNTDSSQSSFSCREVTSSSHGQQNKRHQYHTSRTLDMRRKQGNSDASPDQRLFSLGSNNANDTTTDDDENCTDWGCSSGRRPRHVLHIPSGDDFEVMHDFGVMTGCRSPIPEELSETPVNTSTWINKCATTNTNTNVTLSSSPPPPLPSISNTSTQINNNNTLPTSLSPLPTPTPPPPLITASSGLSPNSKENNKVYIANGFTTNNSLHQESNTTPVVVVNPNNNKQVPRDERDSSSRSCSDSPDKEKTTPKVSINISNRNHTNHHSNSNVTNFALNRRSSESDLSTPPKGGSGGSGTSTHLRNQLQRGGINFDNLEMQEFPFMSISQFPPGFIYYMGGTVTARSVKLLDRISNFDEPESRDSWWNEIRMEMRSHCRAFGCTVLLGYEERTTMCDDVCVLSASGTAAVVVSGNLDLLSISTKSGGSEGSKDRNPSGRADSFSGQANVRQSKPIQKLLADKNLGLKMMSPSAKARHDSDGSYDPSCGMLHIPRNGNPMPTTGKKVRCAYCRKGRVPDILLSTIEIPSGLHTSGRSCLIQAQVFRPKKDVKGETSAKEISDSLPFLEYELHRRLINKLKVKGMNAIFGLQVQICLGEKLMVGIATGTAVYLTALPPPTAPVICAGNLKTDSQKVVQFQKVVQETFEKNREIFRVKHIVVPNQVQGSTTSSDGEDSEEELQDELLHRNKDTFVLEVDDAEDIDIISMLIDPSPPVGYNMNNVETLLGFDDHRVISQQMFNQIWRCRIPSLSLRQFTTYFDRLIRSVTFKLRRMQPCVFSKLSFRIDLPEQDEMQLSIIGMAIGMDKKSQESCQLINKNQGTVKGGDDFDMIFPLEEDANGEIGSGSKSPIPGGGHAGQIIMSSAAAAAAGITSGGFGVGPGALKSSSSSPSGGGSGNAGAGSTTANVTLVNPLASGNGNVSSSCISVVSSCSSTTSTNNGTSGTSQSDGLTSSVVASNSKESTTAGVLSQANSYSVRHPHSRSARFMTMMMMGAQKPMPAPVSRMRHWVEITPLSYIHGTRIEKYLGNLNFFFIRETTSLRESGGLSGFVHNFITEILAIVRAHVAALGGNAMVSYFMTECSLLHNPHKNQGQCVVNVGGDAVFVSYPGGGHPEDGIS